MKLEGLHHVTMITEDAPRCVEFYADVLGLRLVKKTVNFDAPDVYHLYFGDETGAPGSILTWFEFPDAARGQAGAGMIHRLELGVGGAASLDFWEGRLDALGYEARREGDELRFADYDGLDFALVVADGSNPPLRAAHPEIPAEHAIAGIEGARAYARGAGGRARQALLDEVLGFAGGDDYRVAGERRGFRWSYDPPPEAPGLQGAGSVHHIAFACIDEDQLEWQRLVAEAGAAVTEVLDREYFTSIYFREPEGVLFEIATLSPGFAVDEAPEHLGERLCLPPQYEANRARLEELLTPLPIPHR
ncbi:MAG TPA: VOC family protein [Solirubrobacterales bacterium]